MKPIALALIAVTLSAIAQLILKLGMARIPGVASLSLQDSIPLTAGSSIVWAGLVVYALSALLWLGVLARMELSAAYPLTALSIVLTVVFGRVAFSEHLGAGRTVGVALIVLGLLFLGVASRFSD